MAWDDADDIEHKLTLALQRFDWEAANEICRNIIGRLPAEEKPFPERNAKRLLQFLRRKCRFASMGLLAEAFLESGLATAQIRRQYGQALIDQGMLSAAEQYLQQLINDPQTIPPEQAEAHGLMGRIYKQRYVNEAGANPERARRNLQRSFDEYATSYNADPMANTWHGINMVALLARAERDGVALRGATNYKELAQTILETLDQKEENAVDGLWAWDLATQMEALVALGECDKATKTANRYVVANGADDFEISSTLRQLIEVWQLKNDQPCGDTLLPILRAAKCSKEGGTVTISAQEARQDLKKLEENQQNLEKRFGLDGLVPLRWYRNGLLRTSSVCRIESADGRGVGTGWLVQSTDFFPNQPVRPLVLTNTHVVSEHYPGAALRPPNAWCNFTLLGKRIQIKSIVWSSEETTRWDATFLDLADDLTCDPLLLYASALQMAEPPPRMFIIGHPGGRDIEFSLQDNRLIACNAQKLHYRTPTEVGSSGSPIFDPVGWEIVGLHHAGRTQMPKLNGPHGEFYEANEGIAILAIQQKTRSLP
jgi:hypothetical protein